MNRREEVRAHREEKLADVIAGIKNIETQEVSEDEVRDWAIDLVGDLIIGIEYQLTRIADVMGASE